MTATRFPIRLLLREHGVCGGTETVNIELIKEFTQLVEHIVWVMPAWRLPYFQKLFPPSDRMVYLLPWWPRDNRIPRTLERAVGAALRQKNLPGRFIFESMRKGLTDWWLRRIIRDHNISHFFSNWTLRVDAPNVGVPIGAMLMDVRWRHFPETFPDPNTDRIDRQFQGWLKKSSVVFPISETTASDIRRFYPWYGGPSRVVPHGAQTRNGNGSSGNGARRFNEPGQRPLFYCPAIAHPHKDHLTLFQACAQLFAKGHDFDVVLTGLGTEHFGGPGPVTEPGVQTCRAFLQEHAGLFQDRIKSLGYRDRAAVEKLYHDCTAVILPSFFEGFGLALLEGLQRGATVICSDIPAHREQLVRYGCLDQVPLIPPRNVAALAGAMETILGASAKDRRQHRCSGALEEWTWRDAATAYLESLAALPA